VAGGMKAEVQPEPDDENDTTLQFESRFESGNLAKVNYMSETDYWTFMGFILQAVKVTDNYYELYLRTDLYTSRHMQWFYFQIKNTRANVMYR